MFCRSFVLHGIVLVSVTALDYLERLLADSVCLPSLALQRMFLVLILIVVMNALPTRCTMLLDMLHMLMDCLLVHVLQRVQGELDIGDECVTSCT